MPINHQQSYLLNRLPGRYDRPKTYDPEPPEPAKVQAARETIKTYEDKQQAQNKEAEKKWHQAQAAVREAIYFKPAGDALKAVQDFEKQFGLVPKV
jgi:hypothetical protein